MLYINNIGEHLQHYSRLSEVFFTKKRPVDIKRTTGVIK